MYKEKISRYIDAHKKEMLEDIEEPVSYTHLTLPTRGMV